MRLLSLEVTNYRNIASARLEPGRELTVICGNNGQGKTNLLEAIWLLTGGKSFRGGKDAELVRRGETFAVLEAVTQRTRQEDQEPDDPARVRITVGTPDAPRPGRYASVNGAAPKRAAGLAGSFPAVVFDPGHLSLVKGVTGGPPPVSGCGVVPAVPRVSGHLPPLRPGTAAEKCAAAAFCYRAGAPLCGKMCSAGSAECGAGRAGRGPAAAAAGLPCLAGAAGLRQLSGAFPRGRAHEHPLCGPVCAGRVWPIC